MIAVGHCMTGTGLCSSWLTGCNLNMAEANALFDQHSVLELQLTCRWLNLYSSLPWLGLRRPDMPCSPWHARPGCCCVILCLTKGWAISISELSWST